MIIRLYNTLSRRKETFKSIEKNKIKIYVCGPTVYDKCHIGHARSAVFFDVIVKYFRNIGYNVNYIRNFTDVDDKIIDRSKKLGIGFKELADININNFRRDMDFLNVEAPNIEPRVTAYIDSIIEIIEILVQKKIAYQVNGNVYFSVEKCKEYGNLSGRNIEEIILRSRTGVNNDKIFSLDFALWKTTKIGEPFWESPWGKGRPGWHIECSAMINKIVGATIDIHGGGEDLIFPHHENEKIQSEEALEKPLAKYWMHNGMVNIKNQKMSKSLGNWISVEKLEEEYKPETIRLFLLSNHYRSPINFSKKYIDSHNTALSKIHKNIKKIFFFLDKYGFKFHKNEKGIYKGEIWSNFCNAMNDDFNTAKCVAIVFDGLNEINNLINMNERKDKLFNFDDFLQVSKKMRQLLFIGKILGIINENPQVFLSDDPINSSDYLNISKIKEMISDRDEARSNKNWTKADEIRDELKKMNIEIQDAPTGTRWIIL